MSDIANAAAVSSGTPISAPARSATLRWLLLVSVLAIVACVPYLPMLYSVGDEGVLLHGAARMLSGRVVYNDFFDFLPPGGLVLTEAWFSVFGVTFASARLLALLTVMGTGFFTFLACRQASGNALLALVFTAFWLFVSQGVVDTQVSHHAFTTALSMFVAWASCVTATAAKPEVSRSVMAGFAAGAATMITPTRGLLTALAGLTPFLNLRTHIWPLAGYVAAGAIAPLCTLGYLVSQHALLAAFDDIIRFTATRYAGIQGVPFGYGSQGAGLLLLFLFPFAAVLILLVVIRDRQSLRDPLLRPCLGFAIAGFVGLSSLRHRPCRLRGAVGSSAARLQFSTSCAGGKSHHPKRGRRDWRCGGRVRSIRFRERLRKGPARRDRFDAARSGGLSSGRELFEASRPGR